MFNGILYVHVSYIVIRTNKKMEKIIPVLLTFTEKHEEKAIDPLGICRYRATGGAHSFYKRDRVPTIQCHRVYFRPRSNRFPFNLSKVEVRLDQLIRVFCEDLLDFSTTGVSTSCFCSRLAPCLFLSLSLSLSLSPPPSRSFPFLPSFLLPSLPPSYPLTSSFFYASFPWKSKVLIFPYKLNVRIAVTVTVTRYIYISERRDHTWVRTITTDTHVQIVFFAVRPTTDQHWFAA